MRAWANVEALAVYLLRYTCEYLLIAALALSPMLNAWAGMNQSLCPDAARLTMAGAASDPAKTLSVISHASIDAAPQYMGVAPPAGGTRQPGMDMSGPCSPDCCCAAGTVFLAEVDSPKPAALPDSLGPEHARPGVLLLSFRLDRPPKTFL